MTDQSLTDKIAASRAALAELERQQAVSSVAVSTAPPTWEEQFTHADWDQTRDVLIGALKAAETGTLTQNEFFLLIDQAMRSKFSDQFK